MSDFMLSRRGGKGGKSVFVAFFLVVGWLGCMYPSNALSAPVWGKIFELKQPDGTTARVKIWGDEYYQVVESLDGYTLVRDPKTIVICYAALSPDGDELVSTGIAVREKLPAGLDLKKHIRINPSSAKKKITTVRERFRQEELRIQAALGVPQLAAPCTGTVQALCLIIDFPDEAGTIPSSDVNNYCNQVGYSGYGNNGSVRDYFYDVSDGNLTYTNYVPVAYYTAINNKGYYDNPEEACGPKARELILEALNDLENNGFDFSQYDSNGDGLIDGINAFYAGTCGNGWAMGLWPHSSAVSFSADGVSTYKYQITDMGGSLELGTFCHENGHMLCYWPDLYDYGYDSAGVGKFCLMCSGGKGTNPVEPCAYLKTDAGWANVTLLTGSQTGLTVTAGINSFYKFSHPTLSNEYYLIENRQATGRDSYWLPDSGTAIWHVDENGSNDNQQMTPSLHYECTLVQADGNWDLENEINYGDATDLWKSPGYTTCGPSTTPNTNWWSGNPSDMLIANISSSSATMSFDAGTVLTADAGADVGVCSGTCTTIGGSPAATGGTPPYTYTWSPTTGLDHPDSPNPTACPDTTTTYTLTVTDNNGDTDQDQVTITVNPEPSWTFMVYLDGDNDLEDAGIDDFLEMSSAGSDTGINIVVQFDRVPGYSSAYGDWTSTKRFHITYGMTPTSLEAVQDIGEANMGSPATLSDFANWAITNYPAERYALVFWNHGGGWRERIEELQEKLASERDYLTTEERKDIKEEIQRLETKLKEEEEPPYKTVCWDDTDGDYLYTQEVRTALEGVPTKRCPYQYRCYRF